MRLLSLVLLALVLTLEGPAFVVAQPLCERDAAEQGAMALRERRWDDAIAAFAASAKELPGPLIDTPLEDRRSRALVRALEEILRELDARSAPDCEKLPYWEFAWQGYPFFGTRLDSACGMAEARWGAIADLAAAARLHALDPAGNDPRFAPCRELASLAKDADPAEVLRLLARRPGTSHEDQQVCA